MNRIKKEWKRPRIIKFETNVNSGPQFLVFEKIKDKGGTKDFGIASSCTLTTINGKVINLPSTPDAMSTANAFDVVATQGCS